MLLFSGLGNPGQKFKHNRHNIGFILIDEISNKCEFKKKFKGLFGENQIGQIKSYFLKPMTFMNLSGESLLEIKQFFKLKNENGERGYNWCDDISMSFQNKPASGSLKEILNMVKINKLTIKLSIKLETGRIVHFKI